MIHDFLKSVYFGKVNVEQTALNFKLRKFLLKNIFFIFLNFSPVEQTFYLILLIK